MAGKLGEGANVGEKAAEGANLAGKAVEGKRLGEVVSETERAATKPIPKVSFVVGEEIAGKKIVAIRKGTNGKVAVIGRQMPGHVEVVGQELRTQGKDVELFNAIDQDRNKFNIGGKNYRWDDILEDFKTNSSYSRNEQGWIAPESLPNTLMFKANKVWAEKLVDKGYTVLDMGYPKPMADSEFYNMELKVIFGK